MTKNTLFPGDNETSNYEQFDTDEGEDGYMVKLFTNGLFLVSTLLILPAWSCMDFGIPFIAPFLAETDITTDKNIVGLLFVAMAVSYSLSGLGKFFFRTSFSFYFSLHEKTNISRETEI